MTLRILRKVSRVALLALALVFLLCLLPSPSHGQIFNGNDVVLLPSGATIITTDILPTFVQITNTPKQTSTPSAIGKNATASNATRTTTTPPLAPTIPPPPVPVQPYTTMAQGGFPPFVATPLPLPTTPALFPQNISTCSTCYGMFSTLSRCNVIANTDTFPITSNTTLQSLLPFLKCICTFRALDAYPYCIDCFTKTQQLIQLNVLQANHLDNYVDAFQQMCGATYNGNKVAIARSGALGQGRADTAAGVIGLSSVVLMLITVL